MKELFEKINIVTAIAVFGFFGTIITAYVTWRTDRGRLKNLEIEKDNMRIDFENHKKENMKSFEEIYKNMNESNQKVVDKVDDLKMYLLHSKITIKGKDE
jgi:hypothetical protein